MDSLITLKIIRMFYHGFASFMKCFLEAVVQNVIKVSIEISQNSQENTCGLRPATLLKKRLVISKKFLSTPFFIEHLLWLLLGFSTSQIMLRVFGKDLFDTIKNYFDRYSDDIENVWSRFSYKTHSLKRKNCSKTNIHYL